MATLLKEINNIQRADYAKENSAFCVRNGTLTQKQADILNAELVDLKVYKGKVGDNTFTNHRATYSVENSCHNPLSRNPEFKHIHHTHHASKEDLNRWLHSYGVTI